VSAWLLRICSNLCLDRIKARSRRPEATYWGLANETDALTDDGTADPTAAAERSELSAQVRSALSRMPEGHRMVLVLREFEELTYAEMAQVIGCSVASVKLRLHRARKCLKAQFDAVTTQGKDVAE